MQKRSTFYAVVSIFFFWGFLAASNGIFIPFCKQHFGLSQFQSQLIDSTFYGGYFIGSLIMFVYTYFRKKDFVNEHGYAKSFSYGLIISAVGAACMIPSLHIGSYGLILTSFFIISLGFCLQQTAANPFVILLGDERTGAHRLNLAGGVNSFGTTVGPLIVAFFLFGGMFKSAGAGAEVQLTSVDALYALLVVLFLALAVLLRVIKIEEPVKKANHEFTFDALKYPQLVLGMIAIFVYVGVEVTIQSNMGELLSKPEYGGLAAGLIAPFISLYWGSLMVGRWTASSEALTENKNTRKLLLVVLPFIAFAVVYAVNFFKARGVEGMNINEVFIPYLGFVVVMLAITFFTIENSALMLLAFSVAGVASMIGGMLTTGNLSLMFFLSGGLWCSIMWPCIFAQAIKNLKEYTSQGSAFLIMMILGGAVIPPLQGLLADVWDKNGLYPLPSWVTISSIKASYIVAPICFAYLAFYGWWALRYNKGEDVKVSH